LGKAAKQKWVEPQVKDLVKRRGPFLHEGVVEFKNDVGWCYVSWPWNAFMDPEYSPRFTTTWCHVNELERVDV
jgi:hypothetical protein